LVLLFATWSVSAQEPAAAAPSDDAAPSAGPAEGSAGAADQIRRPGPARAEFDRVFAEWKAMLAEMGDLRQQYRDAKMTRRPEIKERYGQLIEQGELLQPQLEEAAVKTFQEAPGADPQIVFLLGGIITWSCAADDYEKAWEFAQPLLDEKLPAPDLHAFAGTAALALGKLDAAEEYLGKAEEAKMLENALEALGDHWFSKNIVPARKHHMPYYREAWAKEQKIRAAEAEADDLPRVLLKTNKGDIVVELFENEAPNTVANFVSLVEKGFYDGLTFHRVMRGFMAQSGCPDGTGGGGPGYMIPCECTRPDHRLHFRGSLSMAHAGRNTGGSQFFVTFVPTPHLDAPSADMPSTDIMPLEDPHTVFGRVIEGMDVLASIKRRDPESEDPPDPDTIVEARVLRKRGHEYVPKKVGESTK
jgi:cyclophilin family peptidyl-prolyl cis-trans isomerase